MPHCWEAFIDDDDKLFVCLLEDGHDPPHEWTLAKKICLHDGPKCYHSNGQIECLLCHKLIGKRRE